MSVRIGFAQAMLATNLTAGVYYLVTAVFRAATEPGAGLAPFWQQALISVVLMLPVAAANAVAWSATRLVPGGAGGWTFNIVVGVAAGVLMVLMFQLWMGAWNAKVSTGDLGNLMLAGAINLMAIIAIAQLGWQARR